jgi:hypothetical protein
VVHTPVLARRKGGETALEFRIAESKFQNPCVSITTRIESASSLGTVSHVTAPRTSVCRGSTSGGECRAGEGLRGIFCDRQRSATGPSRRRRTRHPSGLAAGCRLDRKQGGLRGRRVRGLRGADQPTRRGWQSLDRDQRMSGAGSRLRRSRGDHRRGAGHRRRFAPRTKGDGLPRRLAMRVLHAGLHLLHGGGILPS